MEEEDLDDLAAEVVDVTGIGLGELRGCGRGQAVSSARRPFVRKALIENELRPVDVARYLGISPAAVTAHLQSEKVKSVPCERCERTFRAFLRGADEKRLVDSTVIWEEFHHREDIRLFSR